MSSLIKCTFSLITYSVLQTSSPCALPPLLPPLCSALLAAPAPPSPGGWLRLRDCWDLLLPVLSFIFISTCSQEVRLITFFPGSFGSGRTSRRLSRSYSLLCPNLPPTLPVSWSAQWRGVWRLCLGFVMQAGGRLIMSNISSWYFAPICFFFLWDHEIHPAHLEPCPLSLSFLPEGFKNLSWNPLSIFVKSWLSFLRSLIFSNVLLILDLYLNLRYIVSSS